MNSEHTEHSVEKPIKRPFNLTKVFSLSSFFAIVVLMTGLSWILENKLEEQLLNRDMLMAATTVQVETNEYLGELPFDQVYENKNILYEILYAVMAIPGAIEVQIITMEGKVAWATDSKKSGTFNKNPLIKGAFNGKTGIEVLPVEPDKTAQLNRQHLSDIYVPILRNNQVIGVFKLHREGAGLNKQLEVLKEDVTFYCVMFGTLLYLLMIFIILRASKTLYRQYNDLLTNAKKLEEINKELKSTQGKLIQKERLSAIGEVCGAVAHGLKNPLAGIRSAVQLLGLRKTSHNEQQEVIKDTMNEVDRLTRRLNDLLNFIRPFQLSVKETHIRDIVTTTIEELLWKIEEKQLNVDVRIPENLSPVMIDVSIVEEALLIILTNAIEASAQKGTISFSVEQIGEKQVLHLEDQGEGISKNNIPLVFDQFFTTKSQGVGLGLYLCRKYIELHGGLVTLESIENQGTTLHMTIPLKNKESSTKVEMDFAG